MLYRMIEIDFSDEPIRQDVSLTDVLPPRDGPETIVPTNGNIKSLLCDYTFTNQCQMQEKYKDMFVPFACNFNIPLDHHKNETTNIYSTSKCRMVPRVKKIYTKDLPHHEQWCVLCELINKWLIQINTSCKLTFGKVKIYGEFTKQNLIHAHGVVYIKCSKAYAMGNAALLGNSWIRITRGNHASLSKINALGKHDYAFALCNNIESFMQYASKGPGLISKD